MRVGLSILTRAKTPETESERSGKRKAETEEVQHSFNNQPQHKVTLALPRENQPAFLSPCAAYLNSGGEGNLIGMLEWCFAKLKLCDNSVAC